MENSDLKDLKRWIASHAGQFKAEHYTKEDIESLAIACGFSRIAVSQWRTATAFKEAV